MTLGTITNFGTAALALAAGGPHWGVIAFLGVALVRVAMDANSLRRENETLQERVVRLEGAIEIDRVADPELDEAPPESHTRASRPFLEKRAS